MLQDVGGVTTPGTEEAGWGAASRTVAFTRSVDNLPGAGLRPVRRAKNARAIALAWGGLVNSVLANRNGLVMRQDNDCRRRVNSSFRT